MNRPPADLRLAVMMLDGIDLPGRTDIVAVGITTAGDERALGLWDGSSENAAVAGALWAELVDRALDVERGLLFVIDGSEALSEVFGHEVPVQRCSAQRAKGSSTTSARDRDTVKVQDCVRCGRTTTTTSRSSSSTRWRLSSTRRPGGAASLREGMEETLTVTRVGVTGKLRRTPQSINLCESMIFTFRAINRNVKNRSSGEMTMRLTAFGMRDAETRFRKVAGYRGLANIAVPIDAPDPPPPKERATRLTV